jgi:hypothetical protein
MALNETLAELAALTVPQYITRANVDELLDRHQIQVHMTSGKWWSIRRNGQTKLWKRDPARIYIPFKYGFKFYGCIETSDFVGPHGSLRTDLFRVTPGDGND